MKSSASWGKIGIGVSLALAALLLSSCDTVSYPTTCDEAQVSETLAGAFNGSQVSRVSGVTAIDVTDIEDLSGMGDVLSCRGVLQLSNGNALKVGYTVEPSGDDDFWLEYQVIGKP